MTEFVEFPKISRLSREVIVSEKIDGTNATVYIGEDGEFLTGSRTRWITPEDDNYGFARWASEHKEMLIKLGPGWHRGEWWGQGIQRNYGLKEKRWSLFNVQRWCVAGEQPKQIPQQDPRVVKFQDVLPEGLSLVPVLWRGLLDDLDSTSILLELANGGSRAAPGWMKPEGVVVWHTAANMGFKKTLDGDGAKGAMK